MNKKTAYVFLICDKHTGDDVGYLFTHRFNKQKDYKSKRFFLHMFDVDFVPIDSDFSTAKFETLWKLQIVRRIPEV